MTRRLLLLAVCGTGATAGESEEKTARRRFQSVVAQSVALRKVIRSIESRLEEHGFSLHPEIEMRRAALELSLDAAEDLLDRRRWAEAIEETRRAEAHLARLRESF